MKKFLCVLMVLVLTLSVAAVAFAEQKVFAMTTVTDMDGNVLATLTEDGIVVDAEGNDVSDAFPILCVSMDDETMTCTFGDEENVVNGTMQVIEQTEEGVLIEVTLENGEVFQMIYSVVGINAITYVDEENGLLFIMPEIELEVEAA